eukprot:365064-Chlamydomonas_euryale.AAC.3
MRIARLLDGCASLTRNITLTAALGFARTTVGSAPTFMHGSKAHGACPSAWCCSMTVCPTPPCSLRRPSWTSPIYRHRNKNADTRCGIKTRPAPRRAERNRPIKRPLSAGDASASPAAPEKS